MVTLKFAVKNLVGAGMRTWLNVAVTSMSFVLIIFMSGLYQGMLDYSLRVTIETEAGGGIYQHPLYDLDRTIGRVGRREQQVGPLVGRDLQSRQHRLPDII